jgi:hypothetical protein
MAGSVSVSGLSRFDESVASRHSDVRFGETNYRAGYNPELWYMRSDPNEPERPVMYPPPRPDAYSSYSSSSFSSSGGSVLSIGTGSVEPGKRKAKRSVKRKQGDGGSIAAEQGALTPVKVSQKEISKLRKSLINYHTMGYVDDKPLPIAAYWEDTVLQYLANMTSAKELRKKLATLHKLSSVSLIKEEGICALAAANGSVGTVIKKIQDLEYLSELKLASKSLNIRSMVFRVPGAMDLFPEMAAVYHDQIVVDNDDAASLGSESMGGSLEDGGSLDLVSSLNGSSGHAVNDVEAPNYTPHALSEFRMRAFEEHTEILPRLNLRQNSPYVVSRAMQVRVTSATDTWGGISPENPHLNVKKSAGGAGDSSRSTKIAQSLMRTIAITTMEQVALEDELLVTNNASRDSSQLRYLIDDRSVDSTVQAELQRERRRGSGISSPDRRNGSPASVKSVTGLSLADQLSMTSAGSMKSHASLDLEKTIAEVFDDVQSSIPFALMTRSQANKAHRDERLLQSDKTYIREFVQDKAKRMLKHNA